MSNLAPWIQGDEPRKYRKIKSAERTLALFELFSLHQRPMSVGEIARALEIPQPSVTMLLRNLSHLGYLEHDRVARVYVPTIRIMLLGGWLHRRFSESNDLERRVDNLMRKLGETVLVGIQNGIYCQYVLAQIPELPDCLEVQSGLLRPIISTAIGRALLSVKPDDEVQAIVRHCNATISEARLRVRPREFMTIIDHIRKHGYARTAGDMTPGRGVIAVSIPGPLGRMPMAVGVGGDIDRVAAKERQILAELMRFKAIMLEAAEPMQTGKESKI
jgi:DNA-binding IclR family transcriptional regulator